MPTSSRWSRSTPNPRSTSSSAESPTATFIPAVAERTELGYRLARPAWSQGFATEAALACRDDAFYRAGLSELISLIDPANIRSQRVAEKVGMAPGESVRNPLTGTDVTVWSLRAPP
jgi:RimJ/RimL family protein N-acetyltransferase